MSVSASLPKKSPAVNPMFCPIALFATGIVFTVLLVFFVASRYSIGIVEKKRVAFFLSYLQEKLPLAKWRPFADYTPFAQLIVQYMWEQRPPLLPAQFADAVGISRQTVSRILNQDTAPEPSVLLRMARLMHLSSQQVFLAAGYTTANDPIYTFDEAWHNIISAIQRHEAISEDLRATILTLLDQLCEQHRPTIGSIPLPAERAEVAIPNEPEQVAEQ